MKDLQARQLERALTEQFGDLIDMSDLDRRPPDQVRQSFLSRALAALAVHEVTGLDRKEAAACVIDGFDDEGIDAVAVDPDAPHIWIIQAKWSSKGEATFDNDAVRALGKGLKRLIRGEYERFNKKLQPMVPDLEAALTSAQVQITVVPALAGDRDLSPGVRQEFKELQAEYNDPEEILRVEPLLLSDFISAVRAGLDDPKVDLKAKMPDFRFHVDPHLAYFGTLTADQVAGWYAKNRNRLFKRNIRYPLGLTKINSDLVDSVIRDPERFWYFHNGITVLCDKLKVGPRGDLELYGASVVNGAQTVASLYAAADRSAEAVAKARISVRIISLEGTHQTFDRHVTIATNTQHGVVERDFRALEPIQERLRVEFDVVLNKKYVLKRGELLPQPVDGCDMEEAAIALASAKSDAKLSFLAKSDITQLWKDGTYNKLFGGSEARKVWRAVRLVREVRTALGAAQQDLEGRAALFADQGTYLVSHLIFQQLRAWSSCSEADWKNLLSNIPRATDVAIRWSMYSIDTSFGGSSQVSSMFRTAQRYEKVAEVALEGTLSGDQPPELAPDYKAEVRESHARQANAVTVIVDAGAIQEGTRLEFRPIVASERRALTDWLLEDSRRGSATWVESKPKALLWEWDGKQHSPSALVMEMFRQANKPRPKAVQGTRRWFVPGQGSLVDIANSIRSDSVD
ncbi:AIPR family protein [Streptosporangium sp. NBC_01469]|uniref:AIPR family protein n=1 Tax=Streptosporangium sp. NBC_01469 TaxID=2903898 RepID=UPI002E2DFAAB|nr:AIPR family protein [Streptosporangium sp. NBC_01469]